MLWENKDIILIDEPEISLHPLFQKTFFEIIKELSKEKQFFIATHSHLFIDKEMSSNNFLIDRIGSKTSIARIKDRRDLNNVIYDQLGNSPADLLFPNNFIIVEGQSDFAFLTIILSRFYSSKLGDKHIQIQYAEGDVGNQQVERTLNMINKVYSPLHTGGIYKNRIIVLVDAQKDDKDVEHFKKSYGFLDSDKRFWSLKEINKNNLEDTYPQQVISRIKQQGKVSFNIDDLKELKRYEKIELAKRVSEEISFEEIPIIFKEVIEKSIALAF